VTSLSHSSSAARVIAAIRTHGATQTGLAQHSLSALAALLSADVNKPAAIILLREEPRLVNLVLQTMRAHMGHATVQEAGCRSVLAILSYDAGRRALLQTDLIPHLVTALAAHTSNASFQSMGSVLLYALAEHIDGTASTISRAGAVPALVAALRTHPRDASVQHSGIRLLLHLCRQSAHIAKQQRVAVREVAASAVQQWQGSAATIHYGIAEAARRLTSVVDAQ